MPIGLVVVLLCAAIAAGCSPEFNWREVRLPEIGAAALFPCKPSRQSRRLALAGADTAWVLHACEAGDATFALASADLQDTRRVARGMQDLAQAARRNLAADVVRSSDASVAGAASEQVPQRLQLQGHRPDGAALSQSALLFARGARLYQATVLGGRPSAEAVETFFSAIRVVP